MNTQSGDQKARPSHEIDKTVEEARTGHGSAALKEAGQRRKEIDLRTKETASERGGRKGLDPARYGDWEVKGVTSDF